MTTKTFYRNLRELTVDNDINWRDTNGKIRCTYKSRKCSPLSFLIYAKTGKRVDVNAAPEIARTTLDMQLGDITNITIASDYSNDELLGNTKKVRDALIRSTLEV